MPADISLLGARATVSLPLTNLAQKSAQAAYVMRLLFPLAEVGTYGGTTIQFDESGYEDVDDTRADDAPYPEVQSGYEGKPFKLSTKGLRYRVPDKRRTEMANLNINWGEMAVSELISRAGLRHEVEAATRAGTFANYATTNRVSLTSGNRFSDASIDPEPLLRAGKDAIANQIGVDSNVAIMGQMVFSALAAKYSKTFTSVGTTPGIRSQLTKAAFADIYGFERVEICNAIVTRNGVKGKAFGNHLVMAYTNPSALSGNIITYQPNGAINPMVGSYGYTYVMKDHPRMYEPWTDKDRKATVFDLDFDRQIQNTGVNSDGLITYGYLIENAV
jgi:hypothetical protein